jgi:hypothetical protein
LGPDLITVCLDFDERVLRMGFGTLEALKVLRGAGIEVRSAPGLRTGILVVDDAGLIFTPTALYLEADTSHVDAPNAMRLNREQAQEARARLSPAAKMLAIALAKDPSEKNRIAAQAVEVESSPISDESVARVEASLAEAPPIEFDVARQVRVFTAYLQYVELSLTGAAVQRKRITIPSSIQKLGAGVAIEGRLKTTFDLIERKGELSSKALEDELNAIRRDFTPSLGRDHGRVILKAAKPRFEKRLADLEKKIAAHQQEVQAKLQQNLDESKQQIIDHYVPLVVSDPPDAMRGQFSRCGSEEARRWLCGELDRVFPRADSLLQSIRLEKSYKDMTFETLNSENFLDCVKAAYPHMDWDKPHEEFQAARETPASGYEETVKP